MTDEENQGEFAPAGEHAAPIPKALSDPDHSHGYAKLADLMGECTDLAIFRRFGSLNALNLLYLQAELVGLEHDLKHWTAEDNNSSDPPRPYYGKDWLTLSNLKPQNGCPEQWKTALRIREVLKEYNDAIIAQSTVDRLTKPSQRDLNYLKDWMRTPSMGFVYLAGKDRHLWRNTPISDLISINSESFEDGLSAFFTTTAVEYYHRWLGRHIKKEEPQYFLTNSVIYSHKGIVRIVSLLTIGLSSMFPVLSILVLNHWSGFKARFLWLSVFTLAFSIVMGWVSGAKRGDIFAASAA